MVGFISRRDVSLAIPNFSRCDRFKKTGKRDEIFLATKFGSTRDPVRPSNGEPAYVKKCMEESLSRLGGVSHVRMERIGTHTHVHDSRSCGSVLHASVGRLQLPSSQIK